MFFGNPNKGDYKDISGQYTASDGQVFFHKTEYDAHQLKLGGQTKTCPTCGGAGENYGSRCGTCGGTGIVRA